MVRNKRNRNRSLSIRKKLEPVVLEHFSRRDFHQASMRDIAKDAGVAYATIYKYYGSLDGYTDSFFT